MSGAKGAGDVGRAGGRLNEFIRPTVALSADDHPPARHRILAEFGHGGTRNDGAKNVQSPREKAPAVRAPWNTTEGVPLQLPLHQPLAFFMAPAAGIGVDFDVTGGTGLPGPVLLHAR